MGISPKTNPRTRFKGRTGKQNLCSALQAQALVSGSIEISKELLRVSQLIHYQSDATIIEQDAYDMDIYFIIIGCVDIIINGRRVNRREAGTHVGEMSLLDAVAKRSASVVTTEKTSVLKVSESQFSKIANKHPELWRRIASSLASRLRERSANIVPPNVCPTVFIGSSNEGHTVLKALQKKLKSPMFSVVPWSKGVFEVSGTAIESLTRASKEVDFAILIFTKDDKTISRKKFFESPRDNVIFELGLFMGALGRDRTFIIKPKGMNLKMPSDIHGVTCLEYEIPDVATRNGLSEISKQLTSLIVTKGSK